MVPESTSPYDAVGPEEGSGTDPSPRWLPVDSIEPCPIQPRVNVSVDLVAELAESMAAGRHRPLIEVEPLPGRPGRYRIVCGEQRWRAARQAGKTHILATVLEGLTYRARLRKQCEENRLRASLDPVEEAAAILQAKVLADIEVAEWLLWEAGVPFEPLETLEVVDRDDFQRHLDVLKRLLVERGVHVVRQAGVAVCGPLSPWRDTEQALGISEAGRKQKLGILRLPPDLLDEVRQLPAEHAILISRLRDPVQQEELVRRAPGLTHRQVKVAVDRLRQEPELDVDEALREDAADPDDDPLQPELQVAAVADLCRQLARRLGYLSSRLEPAEREQVRGLLVDLRQAMGCFE
jgi:ParB/Sulfiredoxin domain